MVILLQRNSRIRVAMLVIEFQDSRFRSEQIVLARLLNVHYRYDSTKANPLVNPFLQTPLYQPSVFYVLNLVSSHSESRSEYSIPSD